MSISLQDYVGTYIVSQGTVGLDVQPVTVGDTIVVGQVMTLPIGTEAVPLTVYAQGSVEPKYGPFYYVLVNSSLWTGGGILPEGGTPVFGAVSLYQDPGGSGYKALYGVITAGDPQQVGVFGAESGGA